MITVLADKIANDLGQSVYQKIIKTGRDIKYFDLENMEVGPCYSCGGCKGKTYGRCVVRDDADLILPYVLRSDTIIMFTSIVFGSYSFQAKRALDKLHLIARYYYYHDGELKRGKPSGIKYYVIGIHDGVDMEDIQAFKQLVNENINILSWSGKAIVMPYDAEDYESLMQELVEL